MRAVVITRPGPADALDVRDVPRPVPGYGQVLVRVHATAVNRADILQREGRYPAPPDAPADIPGLEFAGEIAALGPGVRDWREGQAVFGLTGGGSYAEYLVTHERLLAGIPDGLSWTDAAAIPEAFITAHDALVWGAALHSGERVLVHAVGSGVGLAAVQLVRTMGGVPFGSARQSYKVDAAREFGLQDGVVVGSDLGPLVAQARAWGDGQGMDVVLDLLGGPYVTAGIECLRIRGRLMLIGTLAGREATIPVGRVLSSRLTIRGTVLRARPLEEKIAATRAFVHDVVPLIQRRLLRAVVDSVFPLDGVRDAHRRLESNATVGKVVLAIHD
jgi:putative PIG3 family NAD(P)H quinone oxidoreductase